MAMTRSFDTVPKVGGGDTGYNSAVAGCIIKIWVADQAGNFPASPTATKPYYTADGTAEYVVRNLLLMGGVILQGDDATAVNGYLAVTPMSEVLQKLEQGWRALIDYWCGLFNQYITGSGPQTYFPNAEAVLDHLWLNGAIRIRADGKLESAM